MHRTSTWALAGLVGAVLSLAPLTSSVAATPTCDGRTATVVGKPGQQDLRGTAGADVIVTDGAEGVEAGAGDDVVCVTGKVPSGGDGDDDGPTVAVDLGPGDDRLSVESLGGDDELFAFLGNGADRFDGGPESDLVVDGVPDQDDDGVAGDADADVIDTGAAGLDAVVVGNGSLLPDRVTVPSGLGTIEADATGLAPGGSLAGGPHTTLQVTDGEDGAWHVDSAAGTATLDGAPRFAWTGFSRFQWAVPGTLAFEGTPGDDSVAGPVVSADLGAGDDVADVWASKDDHTTAGSVSGTVDGGPGSDTVRLLGGDGYGDDDTSSPFGPGNGLIPFTPSDVHADLARGTGGFVGGATVRLTGFEDVAAQTAGTATLRGTTGDDRLFAAACHARLVGDAGDDTLHADLTDGVTGLQTPPGCHGGSSEHLVGGPGDDRVFGDAHSALLTGGQGDDQLFAGDGQGVIERGGTGDDVLHGGRHDDRLEGGPGRDQLFGDEGDDVLIGGPGHDEAYGGKGDDTCRAESDLRCEHPRSATGPGAYHPAPRPHVAVVHDPAGDVVQRVGSVRTDEPDQRAGDVTSTRLDYGRRRVGLVVRLRGLARSGTTYVNGNLSFADAIQLQDVQLEVRLSPQGAVHVRADTAQHGACRPQGTYDAHLGRLSVSVPTGCLRGAPWVRVGVTTYVRQAGGVATDDAPDESGRYQQYGPRAWAH